MTRPRCAVCRRRPAGPLGACAECVDAIRPQLDEPDRQFVSQREASAFAGVRPSTLLAWQEKGWLVGPWTPLSVTIASAWSTAERDRGPQAAHGTVARWRFGCTCADCRDAHREDWNGSRSRASAAAREEFWAGRLELLLAALSSGVSYREAITAAGVSPTQIAIRRRDSAAFGERLDAALMAGRNPDVDHGTYRGYKAAGCRCPDCREYHEQTR